MYIMAVVLLSALLSFTVTELALAQTEYQNDEAEKGTCVKIDNCPTVYSLFNSEPLSALTIEFLRRSNCEFDERNQLLCCGEVATDTSTGADEQPSAGFDLKTHPKANLLPLDSCGLDRERIWEGSYVKLDEFPWTALLHHRKLSNPAEYSCGGTLINKRYVLTAAGCLYPNPLRLKMVRLGENDLSSDKDCEIDVFSGRLQCAPPPQEFGIEEVIPHPEYDQESYQHDIVLVRLDRDAKLDTKYVKPICLPTTADVETGKELLFAGWGRKKSGDLTELKIKVEIPVVSTEECNRIHGSYSIGEGQLCAGGVSGKDSCAGDGGMPLMDWTESLQDGSRHYSVVGLVSFGWGCGEPRWPSVYTKVFHYVPWILENIRP